MKILVIDQYPVLLAMCMRAIEEGHEVRWWHPSPTPGHANEMGDGFVPKITSWQSSVRWADLIITATNQKYMRDIAPLFTQGRPVFGCNPKAAELELDRGLGQTSCYEAGIDTLPYEVFTSWDEALSHVEKTMGTYVCKPWGSVTDKALTYVSRSPEDMILTMTEWKAAGRLKGQIMLQKKVDGFEMAVGGWFGKNGWSKHLCENFEEKKFMNGGLGCNTGEQGTTLRYVEQSKLFEHTLEPLTGLLHKLNYIGYVDMNCIILPNGKPMPLEATMRFGYPLREIQDALHIGDSMSWKLDLIEGKDTLKVSSDIAVGVVLSHGMYPIEHCDSPKEFNRPLYGYSSGIAKNVRLTCIKMGTAPINLGGKIKWVPYPVTCGEEIATVTGTGGTVGEAREAAYATVSKIKPPTNLMYRTDIGERLSHQLPKLRSLGFATGMRY